MKTIILMLGLPFCGKDSWIDENNLKDFSFSYNDIISASASPSMDLNGEFSFDLKDSRVRMSQTLVYLIDMKMSNGELIIIDSEFLTSKDFSSIAKLKSDYNYKGYAVDFCDVSLFECLDRVSKANAQDKFPKHYMNRCDRILRDRSLRGFELITHGNAYDEIFSCPLIDADGYAAINFIGDVHGCYSQLSDWLFENTGERNIKDDELYVFCGDYLDRGHENAQTIVFLDEHASKDNVILIEGNHEKWMRNWVSGAGFLSRQFRNYTLPELEKAGITKKQVNMILHELVPFAYISYNGAHYLATHGGLSDFPDTFQKIPTSQFIKGVGTRMDVEEVDASWNAAFKDHGTVSVHGHRNEFCVPIHPYEAVWNLEGAVERGGNLRGLHIEKN